MEIDAKSCIGIDQWERLIILEHNKMKQSPTGLRPAFEAFLDGLEKNASTKDQPLGEGEYRVHVTYTMPNDKEMRECGFVKSGFSDLFTGDYEWHNHPTCAKIDQTPGQRIMLVKHFDHDTTSEQNIAEMDKLGYRPATHLEAYAFAKTNPELKGRFWIIALGSFAMIIRLRCISVLYDDDVGISILGDRWFDNVWDRCIYSFLFVRQ